MQLTEVFIEAMLECAEGFYIIEEESRKICYTNSFFYEDEGSERLEGKTCCQAFAGKEEPCRYCPELGKTNSAKKVSTSGIITMPDQSIGTKLKTVWLKWRAPGTGLEI